MICSMRIALFYHSILSDWNHGNAHFLRGIARELAALGHEVAVYEPRDAWSVQNLIVECGEQALSGAAALFSELEIYQYDLTTINLGEILEVADLILVHEWNDP